MTSYEPEMDGEPDPGEIVWAWVPYEEDATQGKDRPILLIGRHEVDGVLWFAGLPLTSKDHDRDEEQEAEAGRHWMDIGTGAWDSRGPAERGAARPSGPDARLGRPQGGRRARQGDLRPGPGRGTQAARHQLTCTLLLGVLLGTLTVGLARGGVS